MSPAPSVNRVDIACGRRRIVGLEQIAGGAIDQRNHELATIDRQGVAQVAAALELHAHARPEVERRIAPHEPPGAKQPGRRRIVERGLGHAESRRIG